MKQSATNTPLFYVRTLLCGLALSATALSVQADSYDDGLMAYAVGQYIEAGKHFIVSANKGNAGAEHMLMRLYSENKLSAKNLDLETLKWTRKAAENGIKQAQFALAEIYAKKHGNVNAAVKWYRLAADQDHPNAFFELGEIYKKGTNDVAADAQKSTRMYQIAASEFDIYAQKGNPEYQYALAGMYHQAKGVNKDMKLALRWMGKSAQQGHALAQLSLGHIYASGADVPRDIKQAKYWLGLAAEQGVDSAIALLDELSRGGNETLALSL